ncbi:MAG: SAM hydroxide adenosyltransferase, partial [Thermoproteus sp.]
PSYLGVRIADYVRLERPEAVKDGGVLRGQLIYIDRFGNVFTSIDEKLVKEIAEFGDRLCVKISGRVYEMRFLRSYGYSEVGEPILLINSEGFLEIAANRGNAAEKLGLKVGERVDIYKC